MALIRKCKSLLRFLYRLTKSFIQQPWITNKLFIESLSTLRGLRYSQEWRTATANHRLPISLTPQLPNPLRSYFDSHTQGRGIWKWLHYFDIYHRHLKKFVGREVRILEIGIYSGGSLEMWRNYFGSKCHIYGVDIEESCSVYNNDYIDVFVGDQADRGFWKAFKDKVHAIDILIDDGGHKSEQQIVTLEEMLPHLSPGGIYLCEDIHRTHNEFASYLHGLIKSLNSLEHSEPTRGVRPTQFQSWIKSINFYPYVTVIEKAEKPEDIFIAPKHGTEWQPFL